MQENVAEGMAAVASHPVTVQVFMQGQVSGVTWPPRLLRPERQLQLSC
jgi:hypothetical protein